MGVMRIIFIGAAAIFAGLWLRKILRKKSMEEVIPTARSGVVRKVTHHENGRMASERYLMDGVMHGAYMLWDRAGNKISEGEYRNGMLHGVERRFGSDGRVIGEVQWHEGRRQQTRKEGADGELIELRLVHENPAQPDDVTADKQPEQDPTESK